jgi:hypothetical protein
MNLDSAIVLFLFAQAGTLVWVLSKHDAKIDILTALFTQLSSRGAAHNHAIGVLEGIREGEKSDQLR